MLLLQGRAAQAAGTDRSPVRWGTAGAAAWAAPRAQRRRCRRAVPPLAAAAKAQRQRALPPQQQQPQQGTVLGSALLVAGTTVGAGILALPAVTQESGFVASAAALAGGCGYSVATGLLLAELYCATAPPTGDGGGSDGDGGSGSAVFAGIARSTLGEAGLAAVAGAYVFLHLALLVAYISKASEIIAAASGLGPLPAAALFTAAFGGLCYAADAPLLDRVNGALVAAIVASFLWLLASAAAGVDAAALLRADWGAVPGTLPVIALSFVYHNVVPVICRSLGGDPGRIRAAIVGGISVPLVMFMAWNGAILGSIGALADGGGSSSSSGGGGGAAVEAAAPAGSPRLAGGAAAAPPAAPPARVADPLAALSASNPAIEVQVSAFSFLAIATSFIGFVLGLTDFLASALRLPAARAPAPFALTLLPPLVLAVSFPGIFLQAIDTAGTYGVLTLFGLLPCAMVWVARYGDGQQAAGDGSRLELVPGGKPVLLLLAGSAGAVILNEVVETVSGLL